MSNVNEAGKVYFTKSELEKIAVLISESGKVIKNATEIGKNLLMDNEKIATELRILKEEKHLTERSDTIDKIAEMLNYQGFISKAAMTQKISELNTMTDEALGQLESTINGLSGTPAEKMAAEGTFSTFDFMDGSIYDEVFNDGKPRPLSLD